MSKTIDFSKNGAGAIAVAVNGNVPRTIYNPNDLLVKPLSDGTGCVVKLSDETWRQTVLLTDTVTQATVSQSPFANQAALETYLAGYIHN